MHGSEERTVSQSEPLYIGIGGHVVAIDRATGTEIWRCKLRRASFITVFCDESNVYAGANGELYCVEKSTGHLRWHNRLDGLGTSIIAFAGDSTTSVTAAAIAAQRAAVAAAASSG